MTFTLNVTKKLLVPVDHIFNSRVAVPMDQKP